MNANPWDRWQFLVGEWAAQGGGEPGQGEAVFSFGLDLQEAVLVRRNHVDFPASESQPAWAHDDLMVVYQEGEQVRGVYFDNEGHTIHYTVDASRLPESVVFVSAAEPAAPRFRLSYWKTGDVTVTIRFEIAPPGNPEAFGVYTEGTARRRAST